MTTPEGKVKNKVKKVLADSERFGHIYSHWPVPSGYGKSTLDCLGAIRGRAFAIETKAAGLRLTALQLGYASDMRQAGMKVFTIDGDTAELEEWLTDVCAGRA